MSFPFLQFFHVLSLPPKFSILHLLLFSGNYSISWHLILALSFSFVSAFKEILLFLTSSHNPWPFTWTEHVDKIQSNKRPIPKDQNPAPQIAIQPAKLSPVLEVRRILNIFLSFWKHPPFNYQISPFACPVAMSSFKVRIQDITYEEVREGNQVSF